MKDRRLDLQKLRAWLRQHPALWVPPLLLAGALYCYGFVLHLPFFHDDLPILSWLESRGWREIWFSQENGYYRPLAFAIYRLGLYLPFGARQPFLHAVNLFLHWLSALLLFAIVRLTDRRLDRALLAGLLFLTFPFFSEAIPWVTALSHPQVVTLTLLAAWAALKAELEGQRAYWALSLTATALAPLAHESGMAAGALVGGGVLLQCGLRDVRRWGWSVAGVVFNGAALVARRFIPGAVVAGSLAGLDDLLPNLLFFVHGLLYPVAPLLHRAVQAWGWHDLTLVGGGGLLLGGGLLALWLRDQERRWIPRALWWWLAGALPALLSLRYAAFFVGERLYALAAPGTVLLWAGLLTPGEGRPASRRRALRLAGALLAAALLIQNVAYLHHKRALYRYLETPFRELLAVTARPENRPAGFVNLPGALIWSERTYALTTENAVFVPSDYTHLRVFLAVNQGTDGADVATHGPLFQETEPFWISQGPWLEGAAMRDFLARHRTNWLSRYDAEADRWQLWEVGAVLPEPPPAPARPVATFAGGITLDAAELAPTAPAGTYRLALAWSLEQPVEGTVFVHVRDATGAVVAQADGAPLGGMLPFWAAAPGDRLHDVRHFTLPASAAGPYTLDVGLYHQEQRFPAWVAGVRAPDDAVRVTTFSK